MSITTYAELLTAAQNWMDRTDSSFATGRLPECVAMFEAFINRKIKSRDMHATTTFTTVSGAATLPSDLIQIISVTWTGSPVTPLEELEDADFQAKYGDLSTGTPSAYSVVGSTITIAAVDDTTTYKLKYYQKVPALSNTNTTNWLLAAHPDLYLFGVLTEAEAFTEDADAAGLWKARRDEIVQEVFKVGQFYRMPAMAVKVAGPTP